MFDLDAATAESRLLGLWINIRRAYFPKVTGVKGGVKEQNAYLSVKKCDIIFPELLNNSKFAQNTNTPIKTLVFLKMSVYKFNFWVPKNAPNISILVIAQLKQSLQPLLPVQSFTLSWVGGH